jgi:hypothetical protein
MSNQSLDQTINVLSQALKDLADKQSSAGDLTNTRFLNFKSGQDETNYGKGIIFSGSGTTKQLLLVDSPDRFFSTESIDIGKTSSYMVNRIKVLDSEELGPTITRSSLQEVGRLKGLIVDGSVSINQYFYYDSVTDRLGLGTETPNAALSIVDGGIETAIGTNQLGNGFIGTWATNGFDIVSGSKIWISVKPNGAIDLGNPNQGTSAVRVHGKLSVGVLVPDQSVDLHVAGAARINNRLHLSAENTPTSGTYGIGDIVWNSNPRPGGNVGWICTKSGTPGVWHRFGDIR